MKNCILALKLLFCLLVLTPSLAQEEISLTGGLNRSNFVFTNFNENGWQYKTGYFIGIKNTYFRKKKFEFSSELQYSIKGWSTEDANGEKEDVKYLDAIHLVTYRPLNHIEFFGGFNTGLLLNGGKVLADRKLDVGLVSGVAIGGKKIKVFALYNYGLLNTELNTPHILDLDIDVLNSNLQVGVRYSLFNKPHLVKKNLFHNAYEFGITTTNLRSFRALFKQRLEINKYVRYDLTFSQIELKNLNSKENKDIGINFQLGFGVEKRKRIERVQILHGFMFRLGLGYTSDFKFEVNPFLGYLLGVQYNYRSNVSFGMELVPGATINIENNLHSANSINANFSFINIPNFFVTYRLQKE